VTPSVASGGSIMSNTSYSRIQCHAQYAKHSVHYSVRPVKRIPEATVSAST